MMPEKKRFGKLVCYYYVWLKNLNSRVTFIGYLIVTNERQSKKATRLSGLSIYSSLLNQANLSLLYEPCLNQLVNQQLLLYFFFLGFSFNQFHAFKKWHCLLFVITICKRFKHSFEH